MSGSIQRETKRIFSVPASAFFPTLTGNNISDEQYRECLSVWKRENMQTFQDFLIYYNKKDVTGFLHAAINKEIYSELEA